MMKTAAQISIVLAILTLVLGILIKLGMPVVMGISAIGMMKATTVFLLFAVNFLLFALADKR
jgi:hypothetical protein